MPNIKSAKKELRKGDKKQIRNKKVTDELKVLVKKSRKAIEKGDSKADELVAKALKAFDKATSKGIIKKNTKDRKKSRLCQQLNKSKKAK